MLDSISRSRASSYRSILGSNSDSALWSYRLTIGSTSPSIRWPPGCSIRWNWHDQTLSPLTD
jgi:hypothetical protein